MSMANTAIETTHGVILGMKKADVAYHAVRRSILLGRLKPGDSLLEQKIAEELKCSQGTVREALMRLEHDGLVARRGYRGTAVSQPSVEEAAEMARIRIQIECLGIRQSAGSIGPKVVARLMAITDEMERATRDNDYYRGSELDREFHMIVFQQAGFPALEPILNRCALHVHRFTFMNAEDKVPDGQFGEVHRALAYVLAGGDPIAAEAALREHIERILDRFAPYLSVSKPSRGNQGENSGLES